MAKQGLLAQLKPSANPDTVLYSVPINRTASTVLTIANDGTGSAYDVALKNYNQKLTLNNLFTPIKQFKELKDSYIIKDKKDKNFGKDFRYIPIKDQ